MQSQSVQSTYGDDDETPAAEKGRVQPHSRAKTGFRLALEV
jgi:hypothetical protein